MSTEVPPAAPVGRNSGSGGRDRLVRQAVQLLSKEGIHAMSIGKLAKRADYSKGGVMAHFKSKREMVLTLVDESVSMAREFFRDELKTAGSPSDRLSKTLATYGRYWTSGLFEGGCPFLNLAVDARGEDEIAAKLREAANTFISDFAAIVRIGQATGEFRQDVNPDDVGERLMSMCVGAGWTYRMTGDDSIFDNMQPQVDLLVREIRKDRAVARS